MLTSISLPPGPLFKGNTAAGWPYRMELALPRFKVPKTVGGFDSPATEADFMVQSLETVFNMVRTGQKMSQEGKIQESGRVFIKAYELVERNINLDRFWTHPDIELPEKKLAKQTIAGLHYNIASFLRFAVPKTLTSLLLFTEAYRHALQANRFYPNDGLFEPLFLKLQGEWEKALKIGQPVEKQSA